MWAVPSFSFVGFIITSISIIAIAIRKDCNSHGSAGGPTSRAAEARWTGSYVRMKGHEMLLGCIYGHAGEEDQGLNQELFQDIRVFLKGLRCPYVVLGDWKVDVFMFKECHSVEYLGGVVVPRATPTTPAAADR